ncbi:MAG: trimethylamine methyltransferase family protein [Kiritimatiellaeota bacterium]|nr:trimethylamine methyltransferase family protein [Kiritimatiellota bacterium]
MSMLSELSEQQIDRIKQATEEIIAHTGFRVQHGKVRAICRKAGAQVDDAREVVRIPTPLLGELLQQVPSHYTIAGLDGREFTIGGDHQHCMAIVTDPWIVDYATQKPRRPCLEDMRRHTIIGQRLDQVIYMSRMEFPVTDIAGPCSSTRALETHVLNHNKHQFLMPASLETYRQALEVLDIKQQGINVARNKLVSVAMPVLTPLTLTDLNLEILLSACENDFPVVPTICPMAGTTAPYSQAGTLLVGHTENIFVAALAQMIKPGHKFLYAMGTSVTDMRTGEDRYYTFDKVLLKSAGVRLAKAYNLPVVAECGGSMTYRYDQQNGAEGMLFMLAALASRANILAGIGSCYNAVGMSAEMMIVQTAWLEAARHLARGITMDEGRLAVESIMRVGPGGNFLTEDLTIEQLRGNEFFANELFDYSAGKEHESMLERAHARAESLIAGFKSPLSEKTQEDLRRYFAKVCRAT